MSKLNELIRKLCPEGINYFNLEDLAKCTKGQQLNKDLLLDEGYPVINGGINPSGFWNEYNFSENRITISQGGASAGYVNWQKNKFWAGAHCYVIVNEKQNINYRFLYHVIKNYEVKLTECQYGAGIPALASKTINSLRIPVPPLAVQDEIVRILDNFTELTAELTAELQNRKKQYEFYRSKLLSSSNGKMLTVGELAKFTYGYTDTAKDEGDARFIRITDVSDDGNLIPKNKKFITLSEESRKYILKKGDLLLVRTGATYGKTLYFDSDENSVYASFLIKINLDNNLISNRYYWHFSKSNLYWDQANKYVSKAGQPQFNAGAISKVIIPVPPLNVQNEIVTILDNFEKICNDLYEGLPAEIENRQKQYEYYRNKLLSFKEVVV